jgi:VanZ family protein
VEDVARRRLGWSATALLAVTIFVLSSRPAQRLPALPFAQADKIAHAVAYGLLGAFLALALGVRRGLVGRAALALALCAIYGASDEWHQSFVPGRQVSVLDLLADTIGATVAIVLVARRARQREDRSPCP